jgi:hypothetical protein
MVATFYFIMATTLSGISLYHIFWLASLIMTVLLWGDGYLVKEYSEFLRLGFAFICDSGVTHS